MTARKTLPTLPVTHKDFVYTPAAQTDLRTTFAKYAVAHADAKTVRPIRKQGAK